MNVLFVVFVFFFSYSSGIMCFCIRCFPKSMLLRQFEIIPWYIIYPRTRVSEKGVLLTRLNLRSLEGASETVLLFVSEIPSLVRLLRLCLQLIVSEYHMLRSINQQNHYLIVIHVYRKSIPEALSGFHPCQRHNFQSLPIVDGVYYVYNQTMLLCTFSSINILLFHSKSRHHQYV